MLMQKVLKNKYILIGPHFKDPIVHPNMKYHWSSSTPSTKLIDFLEQNPKFLPYISFPLIKMVITHYKTYTKPSKNMKKLLILISNNDETFMSLLQRGGIPVYNNINIFIYLLLVLSKS